MLRLPVDSTDLVSIGYDSKSRVLEIEFKEGRVYQYIDVDQNVYDRFMRADSYGEYFYAYVSGHYRYNKVELPGDEKPTHRAVAFISGNKRKLSDLMLACEPFGIEVEQLELPVDEVQSYDPEEVALKKAKQAYKLAGRPVVVNDVFWNILALRGFPGGYMAHVAGWFKAEDFLKLMEDKTDRTVIGTDMLVYYDGRRSKVFVQTHTCKMADEPKGSNGNSFDQVLIVSGETKTVAEVQEQEGRSCVDPDNSIWTDFAKWYNLQRRMGKV
jgi:non-canonical purine NTP pyrophosphatase (RdgB/HAM1 family)